MKTMPRGFALAAFASLLMAAPACVNDPVPQEIIDGLGEETGTPSATHRPGQPCLVCHDSYGGAKPPMAVAGTVYTTDAMGAVVPAPAVLITITDSSGDSRMACTNPAGNFYIEKDAWADIAFPLGVEGAGLRMNSLIGRDGSCASCHKPPTPESDKIGRAPDSAGVVLVGAGSADPSCPGGS